jgi:co-chaperonin GroES (HSP10)
MRIHPREERLYIVLDPVQERMFKGILVPGIHREKTRTATVKEVGPAVKDIKVGDRILIHFMAGIWLDLYEEDMPQSNDTHRIVMASEVIAIIED